MADTQSTPPSPEDMHWGISYLREDLQDVKQDMREFRRDVAQEFTSHRKEFSDFRNEVAQQFAEVRRDLRHNLMVMIGISGTVAAIIIAFIEYRLPAG